MADGNAAREEVELQICQLVHEAVKTHGEMIALAGFASAAGSFAGSLDRARPNTNVLAAWHRAFTAVYDAAYYGSDAKDVEVKRGEEKPE